MHNALAYNKWTMESQNLDAERQLLGVVISDSDSLLKIADILKPDDFSLLQHQHIFATILDLYNERKAVDVLTVAERLKTSGHLEMVGGAAYLTELTSAPVTWAHVTAHAKIIKDHALKRRVISVTKTISEAVLGAKDADELVNFVEKSVYAIGKEQQRDAASSLFDILGDALNRIEEAQAGVLKRGVSTGYKEMDKILAGLQKSDLFIIAARPAMGKTGFCLNLARNVGILQDVPTLIFSLEMSKDQLVDRLLSMESSIPTDRLRSGSLNEDEIARLIEKMSMISEAPVYIDDTPNMTIQNLSTRARREDHLHHLGLIIVDYLQLMSGSGRQGQGNREQEIAEISRGLKILARELDVPVIALSQLSRLVEARTPQIPQLSDLRESGSIEQNADIVAFLYRDDYYNPDTVRKNMTDVMIRKHRNGRIGTVELYFDRQHQRFRGLST